MLNRLSSIALRAPRRVVAAWAIVFVLGLGVAGMLFSSLDADLDGASGFESERVAERLGELDPGGGEVVGMVEGAPVARGVVDRLAGFEGVDAVHTLPSGDGRATAVVVELAGGLDDQEEDDAVEAASAELRAIDAPEVLVGGELLLDDEVAELAERDAQRAEMLSLPVALVVMAVVFGGVLAAGLPLAISLSGVGATMLGLTAVTSLTDVSLYAVNVTLMLGIVVGIGLVLLAAPFTHARFDDIGVHALPRSSETRQVAESIDGRFPAVTAEPVEVVADVDPDDPALARWLDEVAALPAVAGATIDDASRAGVTVAEVRPEGASNGSAAQGVVRAVRGMDAPFPVAVGGDPAEIVDLRDSVVDRLPLAAAVLVTATFVLLFLMTGSVVVPIKAIVMNVLSLGATLGALVWVFQDGHLSGLLGFDPPGSLDLLMPVIVFVFAFGLSMDYEVFLLARIREIWEETGDNDRAVAEGLQRSGRIITSAALLIVIVFAGFATGEIVALKQLGIGLALAVVVDATVVRSLLVPATMKLMGRWNWWEPAPLARLHHRIGVREAA